MPHAIPVLTLSLNDMRGSVADFDSLLSLLQAIGVITGIVILYFLSLNETADIFRKKKNNDVRSMCVNIFP